MNNIAAASILLPAVSAAAQKSRVSLARLLMPLAFGTILGGMATLLAATNIIASSLLRDSHLAGYGLFDFLPLGSLLVLAGLLYMTLVGRRLLPVKTPAQRLLDEPADSPDLLNIYRLEERVLRVRFKPDVDLVGKSLAASRLRESYMLNVITLERDGARLFPFTPASSLPRNEVGRILLKKGFSDASVRKALFIDRQTPDVHDEALVYISVEWLKFTTEGS
jgi:di/tricarboxylate transporter